MYIDLLFHNLLYKHSAIFISCPPHLLQQCGSGSVWYSGCVTFYTEFVSDCSAQWTAIHPHRYILWHQWLLFEVEFIYQRACVTLRVFMHSALQADIQLYIFHETVAGIENIIFNYVYVCVIVGAYGGWGVGCPGVEVRGGCSHFMWVERERERKEQEVFLCLSSVSLSLFLSVCLTDWLSLSPLSCFLWELNSGRLDKHYLPWAISAASVSGILRHGFLLETPIEVTSAALSSFLEAPGFSFQFWVSLNFFSI